MWFEFVVGSLVPERFSLGFSVFIPPQNLRLSPFCHKFRNLKKMA